MRSPLAPPQSPATIARGVARFSAVAVLVALFIGCDRAPADLREWKAEDHDRAEETQKGRGAGARVAPPPRASASANADPVATLVDVTWRNQCTLCHGLAGKGDGPQGPMVHAPDLTRPDWLQAVTDEQIIATIQNGKNRMPKFDFPPEVLRGLVARIRAAKAR